LQCFGESPVKTPPLEDRPQLAAMVGLAGFFDVVSQYLAIRAKNWY
jgi:hypothetical protein